MTIWASQIETGLFDSPLSMPPTRQNSDVPKLQIKPVSVPTSSAMWQHLCDMTGMTSSAQSENENLGQENENQWDDGHQPPFCCGWVCLVWGGVSNSLHTTVESALNYCTQLCHQNNCSTVGPAHQFAPDIQMKIQMKSRNPEIQMKFGVRPLPQLAAGGG